jgi:hypothetical protein
MNREGVRIKAAPITTYWCAVRPRSAAPACRLGRQLESETARAAMS